MADACAITLIGRRKPRRIETFAFAFRSTAPGLSHVRHRALSVAVIEARNMGNDAFGPAREWLKPMPLRRHQAFRPTNHRLLITDWPIGRCVPLAW
jgi:hypothetical protein